MAPSWVLLKRDLFISHDEAVFAGETEGGREPISCVAGETEGGRAPICCASKGRKRRPSNGEYADAITAYLRSLKPYARLADPPELSSLSILRPTESIPPLCDSVSSACISSADKHLVALYAGYYRPGHTSRGCFVIYDAKKNCLSTIPQLPLDDRGNHVTIGRHTAVVVCDGDGAGYTLSEIVRVASSDVAAAKLYHWYPSTQEWVVKAGSLSCMPEYFSADMSFHYHGTSLCWVDLLKGILVCDLSDRDSDAKFRFVPLPMGCTTYDILDANGREIFVELFRSMACVDGVIKFFTMDDYYEEKFEELKLTLWTLSSDLSRWDRSKVYDVGNIWATETYQSTGLGKIHPAFPVLSMHEADVVYLVFTDIRQGGKFKSQCVLRVDMESKEVKISQASRNCTINSQLFASEFSAYQQDHPVGSVVPNSSPVKFRH